jgi:NADH-quinone oxidoreductase subunit A
MPSQLEQYLPVLMVLAMALLATGGMIAFSLLLGKRAGRSKAKDTAYECGMSPIGTGTPRMSVKFYLVAMLFILFDIEVVFLYPWAVVYRDMLAQHVTSIFWAMISFMGILLAGYIYAVKKKAFDWKN